MFFSRLTPSSRKYLKDWLNKHGAKKKDAVRVLMEPEKAASFGALPTSKFGLDGRATSPSCSRMLDSHFLGEKPVHA